jgi:adenosine deaminase CECR1
MPNGIATRGLALLLAVCAPARGADFGPRFDEIVAHATPVQLYAFLYDMPKGGDLHNHASGANRSEWVYAVCTDPARNGGETFYTCAHFGGSADAANPALRYRTIRSKAYQELSKDAKQEFVDLASLTAKEREEWCASMRLDGTGDGRTEFFSHIWPRIGQLNQCLPLAAELLVENMKAFGAEHVAYVETQFYGEGMVDNDGSAIPDEQAITFVRNRLSRPDALATGVTVRFLRTILRFAPDAEARLAKAYEFAEAHRDLWVGLNMAGIEENPDGRPSRFLATFRALRARYPTLALSLHAGEMDGADSHVRDTLLLGASRIGHGVNLIKDRDTLLLLQQTRRVLVEINLISNRLLGYVPDLSLHPFPEYLRTGIPVCLNTDDRGMWDSNMTDEYYTAVKTYHLSWAEILQMGQDSIAHSFAQPEVRARLAAEFLQRTSEFEGRYGGGTLGDALAALASVKPVAYGYAKRNWGFEFN